jgi:hypothetical protein
MGLSELVAPKLSDGLILDYHEIDYSMFKTNLVFFILNTWKAIVIMGRVFKVGSTTSVLQ